MFTSILGDAHTEKEISDKALQYAMDKAQGLGTPAVGAGGAGVGTGGSAARSQLTLHSAAQFLPAWARK